MNVKKLKTFFEILFIIGLCLGVLTMIMRRYAVLPDFYIGLPGGISVSLLLGTGAGKHARFCEEKQHDRDHAVSEK